MTDLAEQTARAEAAERKCARCGSDNRPDLNFHCSTCYGDLRAERDDLRCVDAGHLSRIDGLKDRVEMLTGELAAARDEVARLRDKSSGWESMYYATVNQWNRMALSNKEEIERLRAGVYEIANSRGSCKHADNLYAHCLACVIEKRDDEIERLTKLNETLMADDHDWERQQRRRELLETAREVWKIFRTEGMTRNEAIGEALSLIAAVDAAMEQQREYPVVPSVEDAGE